MSKPVTVTFTPNPVQGAFITSRAEADLFASRRGEGKSTALVWSCFYHTRHNPGAKWAIIRDTIPNLERSTMAAFFEWFKPGVFGTFNHTKREWTWAEGIAQGTVTFVGVEDPKDASKFLSWELAGFAMDEPAPAFGSAGIDEEVFDLAMTCLRQPGMQWYAAKLAENNPDESHWTYRKFVSPGTPGYKLWQPRDPENLANLPPDYYERMRKTLRHRPDLVRRFVDGEFGFQSQGVAVTPQWNDSLHLAVGLVPLERHETILLWDFGLTPVCIVTQVMASGHWHILDALAGEGVGVVEFIEDQVRPLLAARYPKCPLRHIGDPAGEQRSQVEANLTPALMIRRMLGGTWRSGPQRLEPRIDALQAVLSRTSGGRAVVQVDRERARLVHYALRGGWHYHVARTGIVSREPKKTHPDSDIGDAMSYGAAVLFPPGKLAEESGVARIGAPSYFNMGKRLVVRPHGARL